MASAIQKGRWNTVSKWVFWEAVKKKKRRIYTYAYIWFPGIFYISSGRQDAESAGGTPLLRKGKGKGKAAFGDAERPDLKMVPGNPDCSPVARGQIARLVPWIPDQTVSQLPFSDREKAEFWSVASLFQNRRRGLEATNILRLWKALWN